MGLRNFSCVIHTRSRQSLVVKVAYTHCFVVNLRCFAPCIRALARHPRLRPLPPGLFSRLPFPPNKLISAFSYCVLCRVCGVKAPPDLTWPGRRCHPGERLPCEIAECGSGGGRGPGGAARPGWPGRREVCARWGWVCNKAALRAASASQGLVWQPGRARTLGPSHRAHCPPASGGGGGRMPRGDSLSSGLPG